MITRHFIRLAGEWRSNFDPKSPNDMIVKPRHEMLINLDWIKFAFRIRENLSVFLIKEKIPGISEMESIWFFVPMSLEDIEKHIIACGGKIRHTRKFNKTKKVNKKPHKKEKD